MDTTFFPIGQWHIEEYFGLQSLFDFIELTALHQKGIPYSKLGVKERKALAMPTEIQAVAQFNKSKEPQKIAHLKLNGVMRSSDGLCSRGIDSLIRDFRAAFAEPTVVGVLLETETGGGESIAGDKLNACIQGKNKPVIAYSHYLMSAGVLGTLACDEIIASSNAARFGSIGTMLSLPKNFAESYKAYQTDLYAKDSYNKNSEFNAFLEGDVSGFQKMLDKTNANFLTEVRTNRPLTGNVETDKHTLSGATFDAKEAKRRGLVDMIGTFSLAQQRLLLHAQNYKS